MTRGKVMCMFKRILALVLSLVLLVTAIPFAAFAEETEDARIRTQIRRVYHKALYATGKSSLNGFCGLMTSYQLWALGITPWPLTQDGKNMYDYYLNTDITGTGYRVKTYSAKDYSLEEALNLITHCGTRNAYNIMVGFQRTNTAAGSIYGHAMVIHAILDGTVYFVEGFRTSIGGAEGNVLTCSISEFADFYNEWCVYEGLVEFGSKAYTDFCDCYPADLFVEAKSGAALLSLPCQDGAEGCRALRATIQGELLRVTDVVDNAGALYYRVEDGSTVAYLPCEAGSVFRTVPDGIGLTDVLVPERMEAGQDLDLAGDITSQNSYIDSVSLVVSDSQGSQVLALMLDQDGRMCSLADFNKGVDLGTLAEGAYTLSITAEAANSYVTEGLLQTGTSTVELWNAPLLVGGAEAPELPVMAEPVKDGWVWENGTWYFYREGAPRTGWYCCDGVDYYFNEDGSVTTGWAEINGKWRCFTATGAMRTGWVEAEEGVYYMLSNGVAAIGWRQIDGALYFFGSTGLMVTEGTAVYEGAEYAFGPDGAAVPIE